jgi:hypothetical protein
MRKYKLIELQKIIKEKIGSLTEEVEIVTNLKLNSLYIADRKDEIEHYNVGAIIATLELPCPGPVIENPFMLITVFGPSTMIPSPPLQLRFAVRFITPLTTWPHAALDDAPEVPPCATYLCNLEYLIYFSRYRSEKRRKRYD